MVRGAFPTLQQLNVDPNGGTQIYQLGYVIGEFIVSRWGRAAFLRLIETNADLPGVLGVSARRIRSGVAIVRAPAISVVRAIRVICGVSFLNARPRR